MGCAFLRYRSTRQLVYACISIHILDACDRSQSHFASQTFAESKYILEYHQAQDDIVLFVSKFRYNDAHPHYSNAPVLRVVMSKLISHWDGDRFCDGYRYSLRIFEARTDPNSLCSRDCFPMFSRFNTINTPSSVPVKSPWSEWSVSHRCPEAELFKVPWAGC